MRQRLKLPCTRHKQRWLISRNPILQVGTYVIDHLGGKMRHVKLYLCFDYVGSRSWRLIVLRRRRQRANTSPGIVVFTLGSVSFKTSSRWKKQLFWLTFLSCVVCFELDAAFTSHEFVKNGKDKAQVDIALLHEPDSWPETLHNLGSGRWLAGANDTAAHYAAVYCQRQRTIGPAEQPADIPPQS